MLIRFIYLFIILAFFTSCKKEIVIDENDYFHVMVDNYSIEDFDSYTLCRVSCSRLSNKKIIRLFKDIYHQEIELGAGSTFANVSVYDELTDTLKYEKIIDFGTDNKKAKELLNLLEKECEDGVIKE